ncbi:hypothetical protein J587_1651 [Acinetobacter baumannii 144107]|nr:hypothetical protein ABLAC_13560 [Acinetobacter baumannii LAC-4]AVI34153.1 hypothetical protein CSB70_2215 [Acinetobacter baumannii]EJG10781.1 hypothetical protein ACIN3137_A1258 [Acinetobacter baumannii OIFC137]EJO37741.1 hypothetical protein ACINIS123_3727 [Acinetobacter baumannii IS-123]EJP41001.1 hypothetical protein ACIN5032_3775 [Acinetobacter baumannii OIFC032]EJP59368.1 hypothetical protein ACINNAV81_1284 [Acinetobacter baumannii Naval-81]EKK13262.1 hypothetical protein ACINNAV72_2
MKNISSTFPSISNKTNSKNASFQLQETAHSVRLLAVLSLKTQYFMI